MRDNLINFKVYIAGQYAPCTEVVVQTARNSFSEAKITLFPHPLLANLGENDRVPCQIFFLDVFSGQPYEYKLMMDGEITSVEYTRTSNSIGMSCSVVSYYEILAQMFRINFTSLVENYQNSTSQNTPQQADTSIAALAGQQALSSLADAIPKNSTLDNMFTRKYYKEDGTLNPDAPKPDVANQPMRRPYVILRNLLIEYINGMGQTNSKSDLTLFFKFFISKKDIIQSMFASPILETSSHINGGAYKETANVILNAIVDVNFVNTMISGLSAFINNVGQNKSLSFWHIILTMYDILMYEIVMPLCPPQVIADIYGVPADGSAIKGPLNLLSKPLILFGHAPLCNTVFPCMINNISMSNQHLTKPTRYYLQNPDSVSRLGGTADMTKHFLNYTSAIYPPELKAKTTSNGVTTEALPESYRKTLLWDSEGKFNEFFKGPVTLMASEAPSWINWVKSAQVKKYADKTTSAEDKQGLAQDNTKFFDMVLNLYSQNEMEKEISSRQTLALDLRFDPFIMVGFPLAVVDNVHYKTYYMGIVQQVSHRLSNNGASTAVTLMNVISFEDAYFKKKGDGDTIGPKNASPQVAFVFNRSCNSTAYYKFLLYQGVAQREYIFNPKTYFKMTDEGTISTVLDQTVSTKKPGVLDSAIDIVTDYNAALKHISRPIMTLAQYLEHKKQHIICTEKGEAQWYSTTKGVPHGGTTHIGNPILFNSKLPSVESKKGATSGANTSSKKIPYEGVPVYYDRILGFTHLQQTDATGARMFSGKPTDIFDYPDFYEDWAGKIQQYRKDVLNYKKDFFIG